MKKFLLTLPIVLAFGCNSPNNNTSVMDSIKTDSVSVDTVTTDDVAGKNPWNYTEEVDKMTSAKKYFASIDAEELLDFDFPYNGGSTATILIRKKEGENNVMLQVSKGQFLCNSIDGCSIRVRFDQNKAETFSCSPPADNSITLIFINSATRFIKKCKSAKTLIVEADFYQDGNKQIEFNIEGLKWDH